MVPTTIPARVYPKQERDVTSVAVKAMLVARASLDDDVVERVLESIFDGIADLIAYHPRAAQISLAKAYRLEDGLTIDLHPAAKRFFERRRGT